MTRRDVSKIRGVVLREIVSPQHALDMFGSAPSECLGSHSVTIGTERQPCQMLNLCLCISVCYGLRMATPGRFNAAVATALRDARTARGLTIDDLVRTSGMVRATVLRYLNNQREIPISALYTLAGALGVEAHAMVAAAEAACVIDTEDENRTPPPPIEVARRIRLLITAQARGRGSSDGYAEVSTALADRGVVLTRETWAGLLAGNETEAASTVLQDLAEVLGVDPVYLRGSRADSRVEAIDAQLEFARAAHDAGIDAIAARAISDVTAQTLRAVTAELDAART